MKKLRAAALLVSAALMFGTISGCSTPTAPGVTTPPAAPATGQTDTIPITGGTFRTVLSANAGSLNPITARTKDMVNLLRLVFEPLIGSSDSHKPIPALAHSWECAPISGSDQWAWTIRLREDAVFHDGSALTADDVIYSLQLAKTDENSIYKLNSQYWNQVTKVDEHTVRVTSGSPNQMMLDALMIPIVPQAVFERYDAQLRDLPADTTPPEPTPTPAGGAEDGQNGAQPTDLSAAPDPTTPPVQFIPIGTGPYRVDSYDPDVQMLLSANTLWWQKQPFITNIQARCVRDYDDAAGLYDVRQIDGLLSERLAMATYKNQADTKVYPVLTQQYEFLAFNFKNEALHERSVRQAIAYALNTNEILSRVYLGQGIPVCTPVMPDSWLYDARFQTYDFNLLEAARLLREAGWEDSNGDSVLDKTVDGVHYDLSFLLLTNTSSSDTVRQETAEAIREQLARAGIRVEVVSRPWLDEKDHQDVTTILQQGDYDLFLGGYYMDATPDLSFLLASDGAGNVGKYSSPALDGLLSTLKNQSGESGYKKAYDELQAFIAQELPVVSLFYRTYSFIGRDNLLAVKTGREMEAYRYLTGWYVRP